VVKVLATTGAANVALSLHNTNAPTFFASSKVSFTATGSGNTYIQGGAGTPASPINIQFGALDGGNGTTFVAFDNQTGRTLTINGTTDGDYTGYYKNGAGSAGANYLVKTGSGTRTLSGANTYTGTTTVKGGSRLVNGSLAAGSAVTGTNATLAGVTDAKYGTHRDAFCGIICLTGIRSCWNASCGSRLWSGRVAKISRWLNSRNSHANAIIFAILNAQTK
jgi:autotransporter-associated beta strand protein